MPWNRIAWAWILAAGSMIEAPESAASGASQHRAHGTAWPRHTIDASSRGADGVKLADVNGDGRLDVTTGWEEGGLTRVCLQPEGAAVRQPWPSVTVGRSPNVEDAVLVDLDGDGRQDVVSCCEGKTRTVLVHWAPPEPARYLDPAAWRTEPLEASRDRMAWMYAVALQIDGRNGVDLAVGGKNPGAEVGWFEAPREPRRLDAWKWHTISRAGWIMSLVARDLDGDGDADLLVSDRKGALRGCRWLENPGPGPSQQQPWKNHWIGARDEEAMFLDVRTERSRLEIVCATVERIVCFRRGAKGEPWESSVVALPSGVGSGKAAALGDMDGDGRQDIVLTCERAEGERSGVVWLERPEKLGNETWAAHEISGPEGIKFDRPEVVDLDGDGDLDVMACEESEPVGGKRRGLGVFWYENPGAHSGP